MINIEDVKTIKLAPGQVLVVNVDDFLSKDQVAHIRKTIEIATPILKGRFLIVGKGITFSVIDDSASQHPVPSHPVVNCSE